MAEIEEKEKQELWDRKSERGRQETAKLLELLHHPQDFLACTAMIQFSEIDIVHIEKVDGVDGSGWLSGDLSYFRLVQRPGDPLRHFHLSTFHFHFLLPLPHLQLFHQQPHVIPILALSICSPRHRGFQSGDWDHKQVGHPVPLYAKNATSPFRA